MGVVWGDGGEWWYGGVMGFLEGNEVWWKVDVYLGGVGLGFGVGLGGKRGSEGVVGVGWGFWGMGLGGGERGVGVFRRKVVKRGGGEDGFWFGYEMVNWVEGGMFGWFDNGWGYRWRLGVEVVIECMKLSGGGWYEYG